MLLLDASQSKKRVLYILILLITDDMDFEATVSQFLHIWGLGLRASRQLPRRCCVVDSMFVAVLAGKTNSTPNPFSVTQCAHVTREQVHAAS